MAANVGVRRTTVRRRYLISLSVLGALVCVLGGTGLFAALTDSARSGENHIDSSALPGAADIQISLGNLAPGPALNLDFAVSCQGPWSEDLTSGGFSASNVQPGASTGKAWYCLRNVGSQGVSLTATIDSLSDVDLACTGDEALFNDVTCGNQAQGELSSVLLVNYDLVNCADIGLPHPQTSILMATNVDQSPTLSPLGTGSTRCIGIGVTYPTGTNESVQLAQSDGVTWRFKFTAVAQQP